MLTNFTVYSNPTRRDMVISQDHDSRKAHRKESLPNLVKSLEKVNTRVVGEWSVLLRLYKSKT
jgi:hypothetical protein